MNPRPPVAALIAALAAAFVWGCGPRRVQSPAAAAPAARPGSRTLVVLLPDASDGTTGRASVSSPTGAVNLAAARESTSITPQHAPAPVTVMSAADVQASFGDALASLPPAAQHFTLYFRIESELSEASRALVPQILQAVKSRPAPDVAVIGHTDTTGPAARNVEIGLMRANVIRRLLIGAGLAPSVIEVASHGEADLLVATADEVLEPLNRRVEITVR